MRLTMRQIFYSNVKNRDSSFERVKMEHFDNDVVYSIKFPEIALEETGEQCGDSEIDLPSFEEFLQTISEKYIYTPRPKIGKKIRWFLECAMEIALDFEINTEIRRGEHQVSVSMNIGYGIFYGPVKKALEKIIEFADDFSLAARKDDPDALIMTIAYYTHDRHTKEEP